MDNPGTAGRAHHLPVLYQQIIEILQPQTSGRYVDATVGAGGHAIGILENSQPNGQLLAIDRDDQALAIARARLSEFSQRVSIRKGSYAQLSTHLRELGWDCVDGVLMDLGVSSIQLDSPERGFSFQKQGQLDMRFDTQQTETAEILVNSLSEKELNHIIQTYGEEPQSRRITSAIVKNRPISTTTQLADIIKKSVSHTDHDKHPATRTFQAIRIFVNQELEAVEKGLYEAVKALCSGGRIAVISFHSLEDRLVKQFFKQESRDCICPPKQPICTCGHHATLKIINKKVIKPSLEEVKINPRARSARLRAAEKI